MEHLHVHRERLTSVVGMPLRRICRRELLTQFSPTLRTLAMFSMLNLWISAMCGCDGS